MKYLVILAVIIVAIIYINQGDTNKHICQLRGDNIITIGDSIANGFGVENNNSFAIKSARLLNKNPIKMGINGETSTGLLTRIDKALSSTNSIAAVFISIGGNDFLRNIDRNITESNLDKIVENTKKYTNCIVLLGIPSSVSGSILGSVSPIYDNIATKYNILVESKSMTEILKNRDLKVDQIHPNEAGHSIIANNIATLIKDNQ